MPPSRPSLEESRVTPPPPANSFVDGLGYTVVKGLLSEGEFSPTWPIVDTLFEGGSDKVVRSFDHIFNVESAEDQHRIAELP